MSSVLLLSRVRVHIWGHMVTISWRHVTLYDVLHLLLHGVHEGAVQLAEGIQGHILDFLDFVRSCRIILTIVNYLKM